MTRCFSAFSIQPCLSKLASLDGAKVSVATAPTGLGGVLNPTGTYLLLPQQPGPYEHLFTCEKRRLCRHRNVSVGAANCLTQKAGDHSHKMSVATAASHAPWHLMALSILAPAARLRRASCQSRHAKRCSSRRVATRNQVDAAATLLDKRHSLCTSM